MKERDRDLGPCRFGCGRPATSPKHHTCSACYSGCRTLSNVKTPEERRQYVRNLTVRMSRAAAVEDKTIVIGTSPYNWKAKRTSNVIRLNMVARQRGNVR